MSLVAWYPLNGNLKDNCGRYNLNTNYLYGDVDGDGIINETDYNLIYDYVTSVAVPSNEQKVRADVNRDGKITLADYSKVLAYVNGTLTNDKLIGSPISGQIRVEPTWVDGKTGRYALKIDQNNFATNWVTIEQLRNKPLGFSVSLWVKQDTPSEDFRDLIDFETHKESDNTTTILRLESTTNPHLRWFNNGHLSKTGGYNALGGTNYVDLNEWIHLTAVFKTNGLDFYKNGKHVQSWGYQLSPEGITLTGKFRIGNLSETSYCNSTISNIKIYDHCLSKEEAYQDYLSPMLHYTFENPYVEETENIHHSFTKQSFSCVSYGSDTIGDYFIKTPDTGIANGWMAGVELGNNTVFGGNYYTWSIEVNPDIDLKISENSHAYIVDENGNRKYIWFDRNIEPALNWSGNDSGCNMIDTYFGSIPKNTWTRVWITVYINQEIGKAKLWHAFCPICSDGQSQIKCYYRNSMLEKKDHMTPYTRDRREQQLIRDTSGQGNDGIVKYIRERITINDSIYSNGCRVTKSGQNTFTIDNFSNNTDTNTRVNVVANLYRIPKNNKYHYINSTVSYEFDIKLENIVIESEKTFYSLFQGITYKSDGNQWIANGPVHAVTLTQRLRNGTNGTYHVTIEKQITNSESVGSTVTGYDIQLRFDYIQSGKITVSNFYAYYRDLDTSTLGITDRNNVIGTHSISFKNGKERLEIPPLYNEINELSYSVWVYRHNDDSGDYYRNLFAQHSINSGSLWLSYDTEGNGLWDYNYGNDNKYHYFGTGGVGLIEKDKWTHIVYTFKNGVNRFYINGNLRSTQDDSSNYTKIKFIGATNYIGEREITYSPQWRDGLFADISDVRLYPIELSAEEVKALYRTKAKIDKDSNMYTNQLVETKKENMFICGSNPTLISDSNLSKFMSNGIFTRQDGILTYTATSITTSHDNNGFYINNSNYGGGLVNSNNKKFRYSFYIKVSSSGTYYLGEEYMGYIIKDLKVGKWYYIEKEGKATGGSHNFIFYKHKTNNNNQLAVGDTILIRDIRMYRIDDDLLPIERDTDPKITKKAQVKGFELNEIDYDRLTKRQNIIEKDGAKWVEVFYHNTNNNTEWFADEAEALHCTSEYKYSRLDCLEQYRQSDGKLEFLLEYPVEHPGEFNRWKQTDNPVKVTEQDGGPATATGYETIHVDWNVNFGGLLHSTNSTCMLDGNVNNAKTAWFAIGRYIIYNDASGRGSGIPGPQYINNGITGYSVVSEVRLYAKISDEQINLGPTIINKYGAQWLEVFYHNNHSGTVLFTNKEEAMHTIGNKDKYSILDCLEQYRGKDNKFEFLYEAPNDFSNEYFRWKQTYNPAEVEEKITDGNKYNPTGYEAIYLPANSNYEFYGLLKSSGNNTFLDSSIGHNNCHTAIGSIKSWHYTSSTIIGIPGPWTSRAVQNDIHLYVRIDNIDNKQRIAKLTKLGNIKTKEIKEV